MVSLEEIEKALKELDEEIKEARKAVEELRRADVRLDILIKIEKDKLEKLEGKK